MFVKLKKEHLDWFISGKRRDYSEGVYDLLNLVYVDGLSQGEAIKITGHSKQFASRKCKDFESVIKERCAKEHIRMATIFFKSEDEPNIAELDLILKDIEGGKI